MRLRGYGNAITVGVAVAFVQGYMEMLDEGHLQEQEGEREANGRASVPDGAVAWAEAVRTP
tara:strand:+ start:236 stop:418 length:183 start_codon:yes stop_codon:yes gene_type:complete